MFTNLFAYFGPMWSAAALLALGVLPFMFALVETLRLVPRHQHCVPLIRLLRLRQRLVHSFTTAYTGNLTVARRRLLQLSGATRRMRRR